VLGEELVRILGLSEVFRIEHEDRRRVVGAGALLDDPSSRLSAGTISIETDRHALESKSGETLERLGRSARAAQGDHVRDPLGPEVMDVE
jgi:hypothetical protein